jgi:cyclopropane fatty-acyl-phospholipid synthase-like methyltransferase
LFVLLAQEAGLDAHGMDVSAPAIDVGLRRIGARNLTVGTIEDASVAPASFDGLVIWDVLEHLYNLMEVMEHCAAALRDGGYFFAQVPNHRGISARLKTAAAKLHLTRGKFNHFGFPWHLYHFSPRSLDALMRRAGLTTVEIASFSHRSKLGQSRGPVTKMIERMALSDYLYVVARKGTA